MLRREGDGDRGRAFRGTALLILKPRR